MLGGTDSGEPRANNNHIELIHKKISCSNIPDFTIGCTVKVEIHTITGELNITGDLMFDGTFIIDGFIGLNDVENHDPANYTDYEWNETRLGSGFLGLYGNISGFGSIDGQGSAAITGNLIIEEAVFVSGSLRLGGGPSYCQTKFFGTTNISGFGNITGNGTISGDGTVIGEVEKEEEDGGPHFSNPGGYLTSGIFIIFTMLLAAIICADIISSDLANSSFVLYFSRPVRAMDYLLGKFVGIMSVMWVFCLIPPIAFVLVMLGTQAGDDYSGGLKVLGLTIVAGMVTAIYFLPFGLMISSFTKSKAYAGIGIFMSFFVLLIISGIFSDNSTMWSLISPVELLFNFYYVLFDGTLAEGIEAWMVGTSILAFTVIPMIIVIFWIQRKGAGK